MPVSPFHQDSYNKHADWYKNTFPSPEKKHEVLNRFIKFSGSINHWLQSIFFDSLTPLLIDKEKIWMTLGDAYGHDAAFLLNSGVKQVIATDLSTDLLEISKKLGLITEYKSENAESILMEDNSVDYILCKESYHHFPRPYAALYEMIRVANHGFIVIEPQDPISRMSPLLFITNILEKLSPGMINKIWKNRFSYEPVGNYVYKVSEREFEKYAAALNLPCIAVKQLNPNFWFIGCEKIQAKNTNHKFMAIQIKKFFRDMLTKFGLAPSQTLCIAVFKTAPSPELRRALKKDGYKLTDIPHNPYL